MKTIDIPDCNNCITLAICKPILQQATCYDESMMAIEELANRCSIMYNCVMKIVTTQKGTDYELSYYSLDENKAVIAFKQIIPDNRVKVLQ